MQAGSQFTRVLAKLTFAAGVRAKQYAMPATLEGCEATRTSPRGRVTASGSVHPLLPPEKQSRAELAQASALRSGGAHAMAPRRVILLLLAVVAAACALPAFPSSSSSHAVVHAARVPQFRDHVIPVPAAAETSGAQAQPPTVDGGGGGVVLNSAIQRTVYDDDVVTASSSAPLYYDVDTADDAQAEPPTVDDDGSALNPIIQRTVYYDDDAVTATSSAPPPSRSRLQYDAVVPADAPTSGAADDSGELDGVDGLFLFF